MTVRPNFDVIISDQCTIVDYMRPSFKGSANMDLKGHAYGKPLSQ